jgi:hypothetical protein
MSTTTHTIHCVEHEEPDIQMFMQSFDTFCAFNVDLRSGDMHAFDIMLPISMLPKLTRAVNAFNAAIEASE